jgi:hypothetical protein
MLSFISRFPKPAVEIAPSFSAARPDPQRQRHHHVANRERVPARPRHRVAGALEAAAVSQTDAARVLGHTIAGMSYGVYSSGPGLKRLAAVVEAIEYPGLKLAR